LSFTVTPFHPFIVAGIEVYDKDHEWRSSDGQRGPIPATAAGATSLLPDHRVFALLSEREDERRKKVRLQLKRV
jgi:hypothetical protein